MQRRPFLRSCLVVSLFGLIDARAAPLSRKDIGIILMHGKWERPPGPLASYFAREGYTVNSPTMPWSSLRQYEASYETGLAEVHEIVRSMRAAGARRVVVGGESFGANGALAYQAEYGDADALVLLAPGHMPGSWYRSGLSRADVDRAQKLAADGKKKERGTFTDPNPSGTSRTFTATIENYLSFFRPRGLGNMNLSAQRIKRSGKAPPVLLVNSSRETASQGRGYIWDVLPANPKSVYVDSSAEHASAAERARDDVMKFLESLNAD